MMAGQTTLVGRRGENIYAALQQLILPLRILAGVRIEALGQLRQHLFAFDCCQCHFGLEGRNDCAGNVSAALLPFMQLSPTNRAET